LEIQHTFDLIVCLIISLADIHEFGQASGLTETSAEIPQTISMLMHAMIMHGKLQLVDVGIELDRTWNTGRLPRNLTIVLLNLDGKIMSGFPATFSALEKVGILKLSK
jgi:hypothetical protein